MVCARYGYLVFSLAALGIPAIIAEPQVLKALNPFYAVHLMANLAGMDF